MDRVDRYLDKWQLVPEGDIQSRPSSWVVPVRYQNHAAILKVARHPEEIRGAQLMHWWDGSGAAPVLLLEEDAMVLERACGHQSLAAMARAGRDMEATRILCDTTMRLHRVSRLNPPTLVPLAVWFRELQPAAAAHGGILARSLATSRTLLDNPMQVGVLHGDVHHGNVLDFGPRGWLAIDPKGLLGELGFDFANILCNPDADLALNPSRLARSIRLISEVTGIPPLRTLQWALAWAGLSAAFLLQEGADAHMQLALASIAAAELALIAEDGGPG